MARIITQEDKLKLDELCKLRHKVHKANFNTSYNVYKYTLQRISKLLESVKLSGVEELDISKDIEALLYYFQEKDFDVFDNEKNLFNDKIEDYLRAVDVVFGTALCPKGHLRKQDYILDNDASIIKRGMIYWVERKVDGLFNADEDKGKRIPALIISPDSWNSNQEQYVAVSVAKKDESVMDSEYNVNFVFNDVDHIIRAFNPFTIRKIHMDDYITTINDDLMEKVADKMTCFFGFNTNTPVETKEEYDLSNKIETIMRNKYKAIQAEMVRESYNKSMKMFMSQLESLYPDNGKTHEATIPTATPTYQQESLPIDNKVVERPSVNMTIKTLERPVYKENTTPQRNKFNLSGRNKWDVETAQMFIDDYERISNKKELAQKYNFKSVTSLYTRYGKCKEILRDCK